MRRYSRLLIPVLVSMLLLLMGAGFVFSAELDDSSLFVDAFNAHQKKDYLLAIDKIGQLHQIFPETPLRDVALLLLARSALKAGDNELAAKSIVQFNADFASNPLRTTIEDELSALGVRLRKGEKLAPNKPLQVAARKVRNEALAQERAAAEKLEQERLAKVRAEKERVAREKAEAERKERERLAAEKAAKERIKVAIVFPGGTQSVEAGENGQLPVEVVNRGKSREEFLLEVSAPGESGAQLTAAARLDEPVRRVTLEPGETFKGELTFRIPADRVDGHRSTITVKAVSARFNDVEQSRDTVLIASAPLVRVVAKPLTQKAAPGEQLRYRVTVLNVGSRTAQGLTVRVMLPQQLDVVSSPIPGYRLEPGGAVFRIDKIETGKLEEMLLDLKVRQDARGGQELKPQVEIVNGKLQRKDIFPTAAITVKGT